MGVIELVALVLVVLWLGGFLFHIAGAFIHILLLLAVLVFLSGFVLKNR